MKTRAIVTALVFFTFSLFGFSANNANAQSRQIITTQDSDYFGFDLDTRKDVTLDQCKSDCLGNPACKAFTYNSSAQFCFLKSDFSKLSPFSGAIAGRVIMANQQTDIGAPPKLSFVPSFIKNEARKFRDGLSAGKQLPANLGYSAMVAQANQYLADGKTQEAMNTFYTALRISADEPYSWLKLSTASLARKATKVSDLRFYRKLATSAAVNGYLVTRTAPDRAEALAILARGLESRKQFRPALFAYKESLALNETPDERAAYEELLRTKGFRVVNHTIDSDSLSPRICVQFSENLYATGTNYETFLTIDRKQPKAITVSGRQICVEGLAHGNTYQIGLREGLPSTVGENLRTNVNLTVFIKDRKASARFTGSNFVLPLTARRGIPLVTINADSADLKLFRVGERALAPLIRESKFLRQLRDYQVEYLMETIGEPVWNGKLDIKSVLNRETTTSIPIDDALPRRKPGVYLLTAIPSSSSPRDRDELASQWFIISDIGLTTFSGSGNMRVISRSLSTAKPMPDVEITLIARNNEILGTVTTDANGEAVFDAGLTRGKDALAPATVTAKRAADDFVFLDISKPGFDFTDRGVTGRDVPPAVDVYTWTERGIYRAGETVNVAALARDVSARAIENLPLTFIFKRPDGMEERRIVDNGATLGGYAVQLPLTANAKRGTWQVQVYTDPKKSPVSQQRFLVEDFLPEKIDFELLPAQKAIAIGQTGSVGVKGRYLYGAPAAGLTLEGELVIRSNRQRAGYKGYLFGLATEMQSASQRKIINNMPVLDANGEATFNITLGNTVATTRPQSANLVVRMREGSGRAVERRTTVDIVPPTTMIGIRPEFEGAQVRENSTAGFEIIAVNPAGNKTVLPGSRWSLVKIERNYQWYRNDYSWNYEAVELETKIADGVIDIAANSPAKLQLPVEWGRYRLNVEASSVDGPATSIEFYAGWYVEAKSTQSPDGLEIALDKKNYKAGDVAKLKISPRFAGELLIAIGTDRIVSTMSVNVPIGGRTVDIPVASDWGAGAYILATLYRPGNAEKSRMPLRAVGVKWLKVDPQQRALSVSLDLPQQARPRQQFTIPVSVSGLQPGEAAYVSVAAVDIGILNLTSYKSPDPVKRYFGQRKLGVAMRDIYGRLIDGSLGTTGRLRTGGDGAEGMSTSGAPPTEKLVAFFEGPVRLDENGKAEISFEIPQFNGTVRVMATAWTADGVGAAEAEAVIRDPMVIVANLPKFMAPGDQARMLVEVANTDAPAGNYSIDLESSDNLTFASSGIAPSLNLASGAKTSLDIPVSATAAGEGWARITLTHDSGFSIEHEITMKVRPGQMPVTRKLTVSLSPNGGSLVVDKNLFSGSNLGDAKINISVARPSSIDVASLILQLDRYPYGCAEQTTSKALPLLYASEFAGGIPGFDEVIIRDKIKKAISTVLSYQSNSGGFSLWGRSSDDLWLSAYVSDFLTRAVEKGYDVPVEPLKQALMNLQNILAYKNNLDENNAAIAYALYVLARNKQASAGDLRYYTSSQLQSFTTPIARAQLAAGMALYGDQQRAESTFKSAYTLALNGGLEDGTRYTYGSKLRDAAAMLALASESRPEPSNTDGMRQLVSSLARTDTYTNTQEQAWLLLAARAAQQSDKNISMQINGAPQTGPFFRQVNGTDITDNPLRLTNTFSKELQATITTVAVPDQPPAAGGNGFTIKRTYYRLDGSEANVSEVRQNERFVVVINFSQLQDQPSRLIITDLLPAGFEIDNPRLVASADLKNFNWLPRTVAAFTEFRDDRFTAAFNRNKGGASEFTVAYTVRAVTPGVYTHPAATVEDMYRPQLSARTATGWMQVNSPQ